MIIFGFLPQNLKTRGGGRGFHYVLAATAGTGRIRRWRRLAGFRRELYWWLGLRRDALFEVCDAAAVQAGAGADAGGAVPGAGVPPRARRRLRRAELRGSPGRPAAQGAVVAAAAAMGRRPDPAGLRRGNWLRPDAETSPGRLFCHCYARGKGNAQMIPGWPYSFVAALEPGRTSWTLPLDAVRLGRTTTPPRSPPPSSGTWSRGSSRRGTGARRPGHPRRPRFRLRPDEAGLAAGRPARGDHGPAAQRPGHVLPGPAARVGRARRARPGTGPSSGSAIPRPGRTRRPPPSPTPPGTAPRRRRAWGRLHQRLPARARWEPRGRAARHRGHPHPAPRRSPARPARRRTRCGCGHPAPAPRRGSGPDLAGVPAPLRHRAHVPVPQAAARLDPPEAPRPGRRRPLDLARHRRLRPAAASPAHLAADIRLPWQRPCPPGRLTPARVRRGFRNIRQALPVPGQRAETLHARPGRPPGSKNRRPATRHDVGKTVKRDEPKTKNPQADRLNNKLRACW